MKRRSNALGVVQREGGWWLFQMRSNEPAGEPIAGPFLTQLEAEAERTRLSMRAPTPGVQRAPLVPRSPAAARRRS